MKLNLHIQKHHNGNASEYARLNGYHLTQVKRFIDNDAEYNDGKPFIRKYLNKKVNA